MYARMIVTPHTTCFVLQAKGHGYRTRIDIHHWLGPQFENVTDSMPHSLTRVESKVRPTSVCQQPNIIDDAASVFQLMVAAGSS